MVNPSKKKKIIYLFKNLKKKNFSFKFLVFFFFVCFLVVILFIFVVVAVNIIIVPGRYKYTITKEITCYLLPNITIFKKKNHEETTKKGEDIFFFFFFPFFPFSFFFYQIFKYYFKWNKFFCSKLIFLFLNYLTQKKKKNKIKFYLKISPFYC